MGNWRGSQCVICVEILFKGCFGQNVLQIVSSLYNVLPKYEIAIGLEWWNESGGGGGRLGNWRW